MHRKLFDLASANTGKGAGIRSEVADDVATVYVYDIIDPYYGVSAGDMAATLAAITAPNINLRINSPGGDVFEGRAMMAQLVGHPATIHAKIDGLAASAASVLALAASTIEIAEGGFYMIHKGWTWMMGNADDFRDASNLLDKVDGAIIEAYCGRCGATADQVDQWMKAETWFTAQETVDAKFCDAILPTTAAGASKANARAFNLAVYDRAPQVLTTEPEQRPEIDETARIRALSRLGLYERTGF